VQYQYIGREWSNSKWPLLLTTGRFFSTGVAKKYPLKIFSSFFVSNRLEFQGELLRAAYLIGGRFSGETGAAAPLLA